VQWREVLAKLQHVFQVLEMVENSDHDADELMAVLQAEVRIAYHNLPPYPYLFDAPWICLDSFLLLAITAGNEMTQDTSVPSTGTVAIVFGATPLLRSTSLQVGIIIFGHVSGRSKNIACVAPKFF